MYLSSVLQLFGLQYFVWVTLYLPIQVLDATDNEPWGPHGSALAEIAQATKKLYVNIIPNFDNYRV